MKILIVNDEGNVVRSISKVLESEDIDVCIAQTLMDAKRTLSNYGNEIDGVILDMNFPYKVEQVAQNYAGNDVLKFMEEMDFTIPVKGYSSSNSQWYDYKYFCGQILSCFYKQEIRKFVEELRGYKL